MSDEYSVESISREYSVWTTLSVNNRRHRLKRHRLSFAEREGGREGLRALLAGETRLDGSLLKNIFKYLTHPHMLAKKTAEPKYVAMYESIRDPNLRAFLIDPDEAVRKPGNRSPWAPAEAQWEIAHRDDGPGIEYYYDRLLDKRYNGRLQIPANFIDPSIDLGAHVHSDYQRVAVACGNAFGDVFYRDYLLEEFDAYHGREKPQLEKQLGIDGAMQHLVKQRLLKRTRYANLSVIHRPNKDGGQLINAVRKRANVNLSQWPLPVDEDFPGRSLLQPVDRRVVFKVRKRATPSSRRCPCNWDGVEVV